MKKVVVTGGAGFIGSHIVDNLIDQGIEVIIFDDMSMGSEDNINTKATFHKIDISSMGPRTLAKFMQGVDTVFHVASRTRVQPSIKNPSLYHRVNVTGTVNMLVASVKAGVKRFVYSASSSAYGEKDTMPLVETMSTNPIDTDYFEVASTTFSNSSTPSTLNFTGVYQNVRFTWGNDSGNTGVIDKILYRQ